MKALLLAAMIFAALIGLAGPAAAVSYAITVQTNAQSYVGASTVTVTGQVSPAPGPNTAVFVRVFNPSGAMATAGEAVVNGTTGAYTFNFVAGGSPAWVDGGYKVNATWGGYGPTVFAVATFSWSLTGTTTTTSTGQTTTTTTTTSTAPTSTTTTTTTTTTPSTSVGTTSTSSSSSTPTSTASSTSTTTTSPTTTSSRTTSSTTTPTVNPTTSITSAPSSSSSTSGGGGGIPEFPLAGLEVILLVAAVLGAYLFVRGRAGQSRLPAVTPG